MKKAKLLQLLVVLALALTMVIGLLTFTACKDNADNNDGGVNDDGNLPDDGGNDDGVGNQATSVGVPNDVSIDEAGEITWSRVKGASSYQISLNGAIVSAKFTRYNVYDYENKPSDGIFRIKVRGVAKDGTEGEWSGEITFTIDGGALLYPIIEGVTEGVISWLPNTNAGGIVFKVNGEAKDVDLAATSYDLSGIAGDKITVSIQYKGDGIYYKDSEVASVIYYPATGKMQLPAPTNVRMEGQILKFDTVVGADVYYLRDYNNSVVSVNGNVNDISSGFLTKTVFAGNTSGFYEESEETEVVYFGEDKGLGTKESPYVITTADELRYIEFYEGIGESKYYVLGNDIEFEPIELRDDEYGSNTYKLGSFSGVLDGKNHAIKNLTVHYRDGYSALFDSINSSGVIKNLVIDNAKWRTWTVKTNDGIMHEKGGDVSILAFTNRGTIQNVRVKNSSIVAVVDGAASLVGINRGTVTGCKIEKSVFVSGNKEAGGLVIYNEGTVSNCVSYATMEGGLSVGGIVGRNAGVVAMCDNYGDITAKKQVGGIVGYNYNALVDGEYDFATMVRYCSNHGKISGATEVGGIVGRNGNDGTDEVASLSVAGAGVFYCYNKGAVKGANAVGGIAGNNFASTSKTRGVVGCYNTAQVTIDTEITSKYTRIYLNAGGCNSWLNADGAVMYCYFWGTGGGTTWPGEAMTQFTIGDQSYYYIDIEIESFTGIIFNRCSMSGTIYNQSADLTVGGNMYTFGTTYDEGTWSTASANVINAVDTVCGAIAGYNAEFSDCYYLSGAANGVSFANGYKQTNSITINGAAANASSVVKTAQQINSADFVTLLNAVAGSDIWVAGEDSPKFSWQ